MGPIPVTAVLTEVEEGKTQRHGECHGETEAETERCGHKPRTPGPPGAAGGDEGPSPRAWQHGPCHMKYLEVHQRTCL